MGISRDSRHKRKDQLVAGMPVHKRAFERADQSLTLNSSTTSPELEESESEEKYKFRALRLKEGKL